MKSDFGYKKKTEPLGSVFFLIVIIISESFLFLLFNPIFYIINKKHIFTLTNINTLI